MYEDVIGSNCSGDSRLVRSESSILVPKVSFSLGTAMSAKLRFVREAAIWSRDKFLPKPEFWKGRNLVLLLLGCALFSYGCASDDDTPRQHRHRHRHGQEQSETLDRSNSSNPAPTP